MMRTLFFLAHERKTTSFARRMVETEPLLLSPPRNWPQSFSGKPLQAYLASLGAQRVRLCAAPDAALGEAAAKLAVSPGASSLDHAVAARSLKGWPVVAGYAVYEVDDSPDSFVAKERFWNARGKAGAWVDLTPRSEAHAQLVLVEAPALLALVPEPAPSAEKKSRPRPDKAEKKAEGKYHGGTAASVAKAIETAARRDAAMERTIDKAVASVMDGVADSLVGEAVGVAWAEAAERRRVEAERVQTETAERERQWEEAERRRAREEDRAADAAKAPARADKASAGAALTLAERGGPGGCWDLGAIVAVITPHKDAGARCFSAGDYPSALRAYAAAASAAEEPQLRAWQPVEALLLACRANAALCLLRLGRPIEAAAECDAGLRHETHVSLASFQITHLPHLPCLLYRHETRHQPIKPPTPPPMFHVQASAGLLVRRGASLQADAAQGAGAARRRRRRCGGRRARRAGGGLRGGGCGGAAGGAPARAARGRRPRR